MNMQEKSDIILCIQFMYIFRKASSFSTCIKHSLHISLKYIYLVKG